MKYACETRLGNGTIWPILREGESNIPYYVRERRAKDFHIQCNQTDRLPATKPLRKNIERLRSLSCVRRASDAWLSKVTASQKTQEREGKKKRKEITNDLYIPSLSLSRGGADEDERDFPSRQRRRRKFWQPTTCDPFFFSANQPASSYFFKGDFLCINLFEPHHLVSLQSIRDDDGSLRLF
jgi:hypothetical protein